MASWAATSIRQKYPDATICWAVESRCAPVIDRNILATRVYIIPREKWKVHRWSVRTWRDQIITYTHLRKFRFDWGIDLQGHSKTSLLLRIAAPSKRIAARATDAFARALNPIKRNRPAEMHTVEWNHQVICELDDFATCERPLMPPVKEPIGNLVTISVGAGHPDKIYSPDRWRTIASAIAAAGFPVKILGGPLDVPLNAPGTEDLVGRLSLGDSMEWVARSRLHLAADTGTGHMAAAFGVPVISIFGPTDPVEFRPYSSVGKVLLAPKMDLDPDIVINAARENLRSN